MNTRHMNLTTTPTTPARLLAPLLAAGLVLAWAPRTASAQPAPDGPPFGEDDLEDDGPPGPPGHGGPPHGRRAALREEMETRQRGWMVELVGLTAAQADELMAIRRAQDAARRPLRKKARAARRALYTLAADPKATPAALKAAVDGLLESRKALRDAQDAELQAMRAKLTPREQARLLVHMPEVHRRARAWMRDARRSELRRELRELDAEAEVDRGGRRGERRGRHDRGRRGPRAR